MDSLWTPSLPFTHLLLRAAVSYAFVLLLLRVAGKRQIGQMGAAEFVALLLVSNAVQNSMNGGDNSLTGGLVLATTLVALSFSVSWISYKWRRIGGLIQGSPCLLVYKGEVVLKNLERNRIPTRELHTLLRRQGIHEIKGIHEAVLEANGSISVLRTSDLAPRTM
jgi:uncharacterized membrane protein YcaP (DUF421 family)